MDRSEAAERTPEHLAQALGAGSGPKPGGHQHDQGSAQRTAQREVQSEPAAEREHERAQAEHRREQKAHRHGLAVRCRAGPRKREPGRHRSQHQPLGAHQQQPEGHRGGEGHRSGVEASAQARRGRGLGGRQRIVAVEVLAAGVRARQLIPVAQPAPVDQHLDHAREDGPHEQARGGEGERVGGTHVDAQAPAERVIGAGVGIEAAGDDPDEERSGGRVVQQPQDPAGEDLGASDQPRASSRPRSGAVTAWVKGMPNRAGPMIATVSSMAATLAPKPACAPRRSATRASATPPASAIQKPPVGAARAARRETTAT